MIQAKCAIRLTDEILFGALEQGGTVTIGLANDALTFACDAPAPGVPDARVPAPATT